MRISDWSSDVCSSDLLIVFACVMLPDTRVAPVPLRASAILKLALHPTFGLFLGTAALLAGSHAVLYAFGSLHWRAAGIDRKSVVLGKSVQVRLDLGGRRFIKNTTTTKLSS